MMEFLYRILLAFVHIHVSILFLLYQLVVKLRRKVRELQLSILVSSEVERIETMKSKILGFLRIPTHLGIILNEEKISFADIANIITWCLALGVPHISIYDGGGVVKAESQYLYKQSVKCKEKLLKNPSKYKLTFQHKDLQLETNGVSNGHFVETETSVHLLSLEDGRQALVNVARDLCRKGQKVSDIRKTMSNILACQNKFPDPDVVICFGSGYSLIGFSPWHIHLSEIIFQESHHKYHLCQFMEALEKFSKCEQRFGK